MQLNELEDQCSYREFNLDDLTERPHGFNLALDDDHELAV